MEKLCPHPAADGDFAPVMTLDTLLKLRTWSFHLIRSARQAHPGTLERNDRALVNRSG